jgi:ElaB/YqjD/DUF883 family membrane-anchored ribosome-binding protein
MDNETDVTRTQMDETRAALSEKLETLEHRVVDTVQGASDVVTGTVANIKDTLDLPLQVRRHPWGMVGGSIALGCLGGYLLFRGGRARPGVNGRIQAAIPDSSRIAGQPPDEVKGVSSVGETPGPGPAADVARAPSDSGWLGGVGHRFGPEITTLKGLAIGTALSIVRDRITQSAPESMKTQLAAVMDRITIKLGGEPLQGPVLAGVVTRPEKA